MKCAEIKSYLDDYVAGELDFSNARKIEAHLEECRSCENEEKTSKNAGYLLKELPPIAPRAEFDARMMQVFRKHQETKNQPGFWSAIFAHFSISKPALAFSLLALVIFTGAAFQLGKITSPNTQISQTVSQSTQMHEPNQVVKIIEKRVEVPIVKTVEVPVYKERIINHTIYQTRDSVQKVKPKNSENSPNIASQSNIATFIQTSDESFTPINLKNFQQVSEIKVSIIKKREENEK